MKPIYVVPCPNEDVPDGVFVVRDPQRNFARLPPEGAWVLPDAYWHAQLRDGSVKKAEPPK